jgi:hypothetical protein
MQKKSREFFELFMKQGNEIEKEFQLENMQFDDLNEQGLKLVHFSSNKREDAMSSNISIGKTSLSQSNFISRQFHKQKRKIKMG